MFINRVAGKIVGCAEEMQSGWTNEWVANSNSELQAFMQQRQANWRGFAGAMMEDAGYDRVTNVVMGLSLSKGKIIIVNLTAAIGYDAPNIAVVKKLWNEMVGYLTLLQKPTTAEVAEWNRLANLYSVPVTFGSGGVIT